MGREEHFAEYFRQQRLQRRQADLRHTKEQLLEVLQRPTGWKKFKNFWQVDDDSLNDKIYQTAAGKAKNRRRSDNIASTVKTRSVSLDGGQSKSETAVTDRAQKATGKSKLTGKDVFKNVAKTLIKWSIKALVGYIGGGAIMVALMVMLVLCVAIFLLGGIMK